MDIYKKKSLKFCYREVSRDSRHAETLKARESSRFKRLSMLRSIDEDSKNDKDFKADKKVAVPKKPSRLEILFKWKEEKKIRKELEKKKLKKPFYCGGQSSKSTSNENLPCVGQLKTNFNTSRAVKSRLVTPTTSTQPSRFVNASTKVTTGASLHSSRIPNHSRLNGAKSTATAKINSVSTNKPTNTSGNSIVSRTNQNAFPRAAVSKKPVMKNTPDSNKVNEIRGISLKTKSQESSLPKPNFSKQPSKPVSKIGIPTFSSNLPKGIPVQKPQVRGLPKPSSFKTTKSAPVSKPGEKKIPHLTEKVPFRNKGYGPKTASFKQSEEKKVTSNPDLNDRDNTEKSDEAESLCDQSIKNIKDSIFECDVSIIKRAPSFAPADFKFVGLPDLCFDEDAFQRIKAKFVTRTSTPSKSSKNSLEPLCKESPSEVKVNLSEECPDQSINTEIQIKKEDDKDFNEASKTSAIEEKLEKDSNVQLITNIIDKDELFGSTDSPLISVDLSKLKEIAKRVDLMELELSEDELLKEQEPDKCTEEKILSAPPKRTSILKNILVLNSIPEIGETDDCIAQSPSKCSRNKQKPAFTPRRSQRLTKLAIMEDSPTSSITSTPRRSTRLQDITGKKCQFGDKEVSSPVHEDKLGSKIIPRRSMRLINLNTPDKELNGPTTSKSNLTVDFEKLSLGELENMNPHACLIDFDNSPGPAFQPKSKKISLLYSPEKGRKSMRRSIKGDLMSFSPCN